MALSANLTMWLCVCGIFQLACLSIQVETRLTRDQPTHNHVIAGHSHTNEGKFYHNNKHNGSFVGFTAFKQSPQIYEDQEIIVFDGTILNEGGHYKEALNWFVCPTNGVYFIAVTFQRNADYSINLQVVKESTTLLITRDTFSQNPWSIASNSVIVRCNAGERIWVEGIGSYAVYGVPGIPHTTFSVVLMYEGDSGKALHSSFSGFSAWKNPDQTYSNGDTIEFNKFNFNEGDHFVPSVDRFICAVDGIYFVTVNLRKRGDLALQLSVVKNNLPILHSEDIWADNMYTTLTNSRLVRCFQGEFIAVKATGDGLVDGQDVLTTFSVMLLHEEGIAAKHSSFIGFSAYKKMNQTYEAGQTITFEAVLLNEGNAFEPILNRFVCPLNAVYYVSVTFKKLFTSPLQIDVQHETRILLRSVETEPSNPWLTVSNSGLVRCFAGEEIKVSGVDSGSVYGDESKAYTTFTVFMLYQY